MVKKSLLPPPTMRILKADEKGAAVLFENVQLAFTSVDTPKPGMNTDEKGNPIDYAHELTILLPHKSKASLDIIALLPKIVKRAAVLSDTPRKKGKKPVPSTREEALNKVTDMGLEGSTLKDGDDSVSASTQKPYDGHEGHYTLKAKNKAIKNADGSFSSKQQLNLRYPDNSEIPRNEIANAIYGGVWASVSVYFCPYDYVGNVGVTIYLNGVQKLMDGTKLGGFNPFEDRSAEITEDSSDVSEEEDDDIPF